MTQDRLVSDTGLLCICKISKIVMMVSKMATGVRCSDLKAKLFLVCSGVSVVFGVGA